MTTCPRQDRKRRREVSPLFSVGVGGVGELDEDDETKLNLHSHQPHARGLAGLGPLCTLSIRVERSSKLILMVRKPLQKDSFSLNQSIINELHHVQQLPSSCQLLVMHSLQMTRIYGQLLTNSAAKHQGRKNTKMLTKTDTTCSNKTTISSLATPERFIKLGHAC